MQLDKLKERLAIFDREVEQQNANINQGVANLNMLRGAQTELRHLIAQFDQPEIVSDVSPV